MKIIDAAFDRARVVILAFVMILIAGALAYVAIPKESEPDVPIPTFYVSAFHEGISPEDSERLLIRPMEKELQSLDGLKEMRAVAGEGYASITLEFNAGFSQNKALIDVREKIALSKANLPPETEEPRVTEVNVALFPVLSVALSGSILERDLVNMARDLKNKIEALPGVLKAEVGGNREEMMEVIVDPSAIEAYGITFEDIIAILQSNNRLVAAGALDNGAGRMVLKVPGIIEGIEDVLNLPIKVVDGAVVSFKDVATIRRTFKDPEGFARIDGKPAVVLEVSKRLGANIIETISDVRKIVAQQQKTWPQSVNVKFMQDKSIQINDMLKDLQNNIISAIILVMIVIIAVLGVRPAFLVGMSIPGSFLAGILVIYLMGMTINIVVLFSLILVVGMLVDGAIVTIELADRKIADGMERKEAYAFAAKRMSWPIIASTATTLAVFVPLLFWPGMVGEFMKYLPITVLVTLIASLFMALIFIPVLGGLTGNKKIADDDSFEAIHLAESGDIKKIKGVTGKYLRLLEKLLHHPGKVFGATVLLLIISYVAYGTFGRGVEFFPSTEPDFIQVQVQARGDLSVYEKDALVNRVEKKLMGMDVFKDVYARTFGNTNNQQNMPADVIGIIQLEFINWRLRPPASEVITEIRTRLQDVAGVKAQVRKEDSGPSAGKPIQIEISALDSALLPDAVEKIESLMSKAGGFVDVEDSRPLPGIEWRMQIDRKEAARFGANVGTLGSAVQMLTGGLKIAEYQPDDADEELDIRLRFPASDRSLQQLSQLRVPTSFGNIPVTNFITFETAQKTGNLNRVDSKRVMTIKSDISEGLLADSQVKIIKEAILESSFDPAININFKGQDKEQKEAGLFLSQAFITAIFLMTAILLIQFNSFYQAGLVLSAIVFSTAGVLLGLLITGNPFGIVMGGIGVIALAGIVVNNNIVLIDTFNDLRCRGLEPIEAALRTAAQRARPVILTSATTILGLIPMVFAMNIDLIGRDIAFGAPSTQWWVQLSSTIAGGLAFATVLTLVLTPCMLMLDKTSLFKYKFKKKFFKILKKYPLRKKAIFKRIKSRLSTLKKKAFIKKITSFFFRVIIVMIAINLSSGNTAHAEKNEQVKQKSDWKVMLGMGAGIFPTYEGSNSYVATPIPYVSVDWKDKIKFGVGGLSANIVKSKNYRSDIGLAYDRGRNKNGNMLFTNQPDNSLQGLETIKPAAGLKLDQSYDFSHLSASAGIIKYFGSENKGLLLNAGLSKKISLNKKLILTPSAKITWANENYTETFFGVSASESANSQFSQFQGKAGFKDVSIGINAMYIINQNWILFVDGRFKQLVGSAANSPISQRNNSLSFMSAIGYKF